MRYWMLFSAIFLGAAGKVVVGTVCVPVTLFASLTSNFAVVGSTWMVDVIIGCLVCVGEIWLSCGQGFKPNGSFVGLQPVTEYVTTELGSIAVVVRRFTVVTVSVGATKPKYSPHPCVVVVEFCLESEIIIAFFCSCSCTSFLKQMVDVLNVFRRTY